MVLGEDPLGGQPGAFHDLLHSQGKGEGQPASADCPSPCPLRPPPPGATFRYERVCAGGASVVHVSGTPVGTRRSTDPGFPFTEASWASFR